MLILGLDTSGALVSAAALGVDLDPHGAPAVAPSEGAPGLWRAAECSLASPRAHAEALAPLVEQALAGVGCGVRDISAVAVGVGPGPFTGLRVGLATAEVLAFALGVPLHGVCSLDALADGALGAAEVDPTAGAEFVVATDARRREVYWARYRVCADPGDGLGPWAERLEGPSVSAPQGVLGLGHPIVGRVVAQIERDVTAADVARVAVRALLEPADRQALRLIGTAPMYLRRPDAVEPAARKRVLR